jgi:hypothetical protein
MMKGPAAGVFLTKATASFGDARGYFREQIENGKDEDNSVDL